MGIRVVYGDDRVGAEKAIKRELGDELEVFEGENLSKEGLFGIFLGGTLFVPAERKILVKSLGENREIFEEFGEKLDEFAKTSNEVIIWEEKLDKRTATYKKLKAAGVEMREYKRDEAIDARMVFGIYDLALRDGDKAICKIEEIEKTEDPYKFFGLLVAQALKKLEWRPKGIKEKRVLLELSKADMLMKTSSMEPWLIVKMVIRQISLL